MRPGPSNETAEAELGSGLIPLPAASPGAEASDVEGLRLPDLASPPLVEGRHHSATGEIRAELAIAAGAAALTIAFGMLAIEVLPRLG